MPESSRDTAPANPRTSELEILGDLAKSLVTTTRFNELLHQIVLAVGRVLNFRDCVLYLWDEDEQQLVQRAAYGPKLPVGQVELLNPIRLRLGEGIVGSVAESGEPEVIANTELDPRFVRDLEVNLSELTVPIRFQGRTIGVLDAEAPDLEAFSENDLTIVRRFADLCAPAIVNAERLSTEKRRAESALRAAEQRYQAIVEKARNAVYIVDAEGRFTYVNPAGEKLFGRTEADLLGADFREVVSPEARAQAADFLTMLTAGKEHEAVLDLPVTGFGGAVRWTEQTVARQENDEEFSGFQAIVRDVTKRRSLELKLERLANHDPLTGLFNRYRFEVELRAYLEELRESRRSAALLWIDLDQFKEINDSLGHHIGDQLLVKVGLTLEEETRDMDIVSRFGGDEFAILLRDAEAPLARLVAERILEALRQRAFLIEGHSCRATASIGLILLPEHAETLEIALARVDRAMYRAKEGGRNALHLYSPSMDDRSAASTSPVEWVDRIRSALEQQRLQLFLQPIVALAGPVPPRYEVLLRLRDDDGGLILPGAFISIAERYGLIHEIDRWVVTETIRLLARVGGKPPIELEVNLSGKAFSDPKLLPTLRQELARWGVDPKQLVIEITETAALADVRHAQRFMETLRTIGCRFALDDFGVGFSSLYHLKHLPIDYLKLDGSFIRELKTNAVDQHLVRAMVEVARGLGKQTIAEFVEDEPTLELLRSYDVDYVQGYFLGIPSPAEEILPD